MLYVIIPARSWRVGDITWATIFHRNDVAKESYYQYKSGTSTIAVTITIITTTTTAAYCTVLLCCVRFGSSSSLARGEKRLYAWDGWRYTPSIIVEARPGVQWEIQLSITFFCICIFVLYFVHVACTCMHDRQDVQQPVQQYSSSWCDMTGLLGRGQMTNGGDIHPTPP